MPHDPAPQSAAKTGVDFDNRSVRSLRRGQTSRAIPTNHTQNASSDRPTSPACRPGPAAHGLDPRVAFAVDPSVPFPGESRDPWCSQARRFRSSRDGHAKCGQMTERWRDGSRLSPGKPTETMLNRSIGLRPPSPGRRRNDAAGGKPGARTPQSARLGKAYPRFRPSGRRDRRARGREEFRRGSARSCSA